jgi:peptidoglycan/LPS O-acetylase OafA/YrhL
VRERPSAKAAPHRTPPGLAGSAISLAIDRAARDALSDSEGGNVSNRTGGADLIGPLTSIRFFAAFAVVLYHSGAAFASASPHIPMPLKTLLLNGYLGVTFFFVLSGFILHLTYRGRIATSDQVKRFGIARFARLYPVYLVAVLAMLPFATLRGWADVPQFLLLHWWIPNGALGWNDWNMPTWTLSVEFFFYICFPLLSRMAEKLGSRSLLGLIAALLAFAAITGSSALIDNQFALFAWMKWTPVPLLRLPEFLIGVFVAELHLRGHRARIPAWPIALLLVVGLAAATSPRIAAFATTMSALLIMTIAGDQQSRFARVLSVRWLVLLGAASYALYLMHQPVHFAVLALLGSSKAMVALQYPILIAGSVAVFLFYEEPAREWIRKRAAMKPSAGEEIAAHPV